MTEFNVHELIRQVCAEAVDLDVAKLVVEVDQRIQPEDRDTALRQTLAEAVRDVLRHSRRDTAIQAQSAQKGATVTRLPGTSAKVRGIREYWRKALQETYSVDGVGRYKRLADLTRDDLLFNITARDAEARKNQAKALQLRGLLDLVTRHEVPTVGQLPENVLAAVLVRAA